MTMSPCHKCGRPARQPGSFFGVDPNLKPICSRCAANAACERCKGTGFVNGLSSCPDCAGRTFAAEREDSYARTRIKVAGTLTDVIAKIKTALFEDEKDGGQIREEFEMPPAAPLFVALRRLEKLHAAVAADAPNLAVESAAETPPRPSPDVLPYDFRAVLRLAARSLFPGPAATTFRLEDMIEIADWLAGKRFNDGPPWYEYRALAAAARAVLVAEQEQGRAVVIGEPAAPPAREAGTTAKNISDAKVAMEAFARDITSEAFVGPTDPRIREDGTPYWAATSFVDHLPRPWRTGRKIQRNIYAANDTPIAMMPDDASARLVVDAVNDASARPPPRVPDQLVDAHDPDQLQRTNRVVAAVEDILASLIPDAEQRKEILRIVFRLSNNSG
jgi:hypothetical protein